ncbi:MAG: hypothetical protein EZS28_049635, partial [Streblomastix strix]
SFITIYISLDCLLVVSVNGEWLFLQWHENEFFPIACGSIMDAALRIMNNPEKRRFHINPTYQWAILVIPPDERTSTYLSNPNSSHKPQQTNEIQEPIFNSGFNTIDDVQYSIERISLRAICFIDECVCIGVEYDGPGADVMYGISERMNESLMNIPQMCGWGEGLICVLDNGLESVWRAKQKNKESDIQISDNSNIERVVIAQSKTFIFFEERMNEIERRKNLILDNILRRSYQ